MNLLSREMTLNPLSIIPTLTDPDEVRDGTEHLKRDDPSIVAVTRMLSKEQVAAPPAGNCSPMIVKV